MGECVVRKAKFEDLESICDLLSESFVETPECPRYWWRIMENNKIHTYVAESNGYIVATATLHILEKVLRGGTYVGLIEDVCVLKRHEGNGYGSKLIDKLVEVSKDEKCYKVILNCDETIAPFYEKNGFIKKDIQMRLDIK